ncbi:MAG: hypothetical protein ACXVLX_09210, partial [Ilumatobacteraceae bacterium]
MDVPHRRTRGLDFDASARILPPRSQTSIAGADSEPHKFMLPEAGDMRYNWVVLRLAGIDHAE